MDEFKMNLQLFAEEPEVTEELTEETVEPVIEESEESEETVEPVVEEKVVKPDDYIPKAKYMNEKKKRQELEKQLLQQRVEREKYDYTQKLLEMGYPEPEAKRQAEERIEYRKELEESRSWRIDSEIRELARSDDFYADADSFKDEIKDIMQDKKVSADQAYMLLRGRERTREIKLELEQKALVKRRTVDSKTVANSTPSVAKNPYPLDNTDKSALAKLREFDPDGNWTAEKYYKLYKGS